MLLPITKICTDYLFRFLIYNNLALYCMSFLLTRIKMFLLIVSIFYPVLLPDFFLGRSIGVSDASILLLAQNENVDGAKASGLNRS